MLQTLQVRIAVTTIEVSDTAEATEVLPAMPRSKLSPPAVYRRVLTTEAGTSVAETAFETDPVGLGFAAIRSTLLRWCWMGTWRS